MSDKLHIGKNIRKYICPIRNPVKTCGFEFPGSHALDREPHLLEHNKKELVKAVTDLLFRTEWADTMANEIIKKCETLQIWRNDT